MDGVNINKYLGQFNPILIVPVLSAVIGAILVFVFGFRKTNGPKFGTGSSTDSLKRSKKKANGTKQQDSGQQSAKVQNAQATKVNKKAASGETVAAKKVNAVAEKPVVKKKDEKKTEEKRPESGSPAKKVTSVAKKATKESPPAAAVAGKKQKSNKKAAAEEREQKPADFDDAGWFTVQSKGTKKGNKSDENGAKGAENASPTQTATKNKLKGAKAEKVADKKAIESATDVAETATIADVGEKIEPKLEAVAEPAPVTAAPQPAAPTVCEEEVVVVAKPVATPAPKVVPPSAPKEVAAPVEESNVAFDELGEWTDAKPDRKKGNKKKSRKD